MKRCLVQAQRLREESGSPTACLPLQAERDHVLAYRGGENAAPVGASRHLLDPHTEVLNLVIHGNERRPLRRPRPTGTASTYDDGFDTYREIAKASGRSARSVTYLTQAGKVAGPVGLIFGASVGVHAVATAPPEERGRVAAEETGGFAGGALGGAAGTAGGVLVAGLLVSNPAGWIVLGLGVVGGIGGGYIGGELGRETGGALYRGTQSANDGRYVRSPDGTMIDRRTLKMHLGPGPKF